MAFIQLSGKARVGVLSLALGLCLATSGPNSHAQCGNNSPAFPVPEFRGGTRMWPTNGFRPGLPGAQLPANRDTTQYLSTTFPSTAPAMSSSGPSTWSATSAFVMYNAGIQAWDISGSKAEDPERLHFRDGIEGHWFFHTPPGEADGYLNDIAAIQDPSNSNRVLIAVSSLAPIGVTIWRFDRASGSLSQAYQNTARRSERRRDDQLQRHGLRLLRHRPRRLRGQRVGHQQRGERLPRRRLPRRHLPRRRSAPRPARATSA